MQSRLSPDQRREADRSTAEEILNEIDRADIEIKALFRVGRYNNEKTQEGKCRPIKVIFHSKEDQESVMRNAYKLSNSDDENLKKVRLSQDYTKDERRLIDDKIKEAKAKSTDQVFWLVRGPPWNLWLKKLTKQTKNQTKDLEEEVEAS